MITSSHLVIISTVILMGLGFRALSSVLFVVVIGIVIASTLIWGGTSRESPYEIPALSLLTNRV